MMKVRLQSILETQQALIFIILVVVKNPSDCIGNVIGQSESTTKAILATTVGKFLIIDEAYMLYSGSES